MIYEKGLIKAMKQEHGKSDGYTVANDGQTTRVIASEWFAGVPNENNLLPIDYAHPVRLVSGWLVSDNDCFGVAGCAISDDSTRFLQAQLRHLEMMDWRAD